MEMKTSPQENFEPYKGDPDSWQILEAPRSVEWRREQSGYPENDLQVQGDQN